MNRSIGKVRRRAREVELARLLLCCALLPASGAARKRPIVGTTAAADTQARMWISRGLQGVGKLLYSCDGSRG